MVYADSSVFVSLYVQDQHSDEVRAGIASGPSLWFTPLHRAEWTRAIEQHVFRRHLSSDTARKVYADFALGVRRGIWLETDVPEAAFDTAVELAREHVARIGTRTLDTLHVACTMELKAERFRTFDERQRKLARTARLRTG